ncbi:MepB family protein [Staphylococcus gallinarum]|uniref:MepB family protein n=1 Tax=Staphylococcus gallinarum TaxID=1293 RepID=UPI001E5CD412|nr:MepB family protein [Staphylococcus gallinarum]MCD8919258.1 MepB family protein [Staphylococcus gallinarum]UEH01855.1 MepB family protein [Staphylococcus gallinarum]
MSELNSIVLFKEIDRAISSFNVQEINEEYWNKEYEAINLSINKISIKSRLAKKTPKKRGYFLALWKKDQENINVPYHYEEFKDLLIVNILDEQYKGQFVFPKAVLEKHNVLCTNKAKGKMAFRVYPSWEENLNTSATKTQKWQSPYFIDLTHSIDKGKVNYLYFGSKES